MTGERDVTRIVQSWLRTDEHESADRVLETVLDQLDATPQRRSWWPARRTTELHLFAKLVLAATAVVLVALVGFRLLPAPGGGVGGQPTPSLTPSPSRAPGSSPLDGVWTTSFTRQELEDSPLLYGDGEINDENWGDFTLSLENGRVEYVQRNDIVGYTSTGTFSVQSGDVLILRFLTGEDANDTVMLRWDLSQDTLTFERLDSATGPTPYVLKPWTRSR